MPMGHDPVEYYEFLGRNVDEYSTAGCSLMQASDVLCLGLIFGSSFAAAANGILILLLILDF